MDATAAPARVWLLGVPIDALGFDDAIDRMRIFLADGRRPYHVMTPNNEMLVMAWNNEEFTSLLRRSDLNLPDSSGLLFAARWTHQRLPDRIPGVDAVLRLCSELTAEHPVFLLGAAPGVAEAAAKKLSERNPSLVIAGTYSGSPRPEEAETIINRINAARPHILFVAYGAPAQDLWIDRYLSQLPSVRLAMGVGGTFDFLSGKIRRAPASIRRLRLEWAWRFIQEPSRWKRMWKAVVVFPWLVMREGRAKLNQKVD